MKPTPTFQEACQNEQLHTTKLPTNQHTGPLHNKKISNTYLLSFGLH